MRFASGMQISLNQIGDAFGIEKRYTDYDELLKDPEDRCGSYQYSNSKSC